MSSQRTLSAAVLIVGALAAVLVAWFGSGWRSMEKEQEAILSAARADAADTAAVLADDLVAELEHLRAEESQRPYYHYQNLFHDPRGASLGWSVVPSPLAEGPTERLVATHFQIDDGGELTSPTFNREVPDNTAPRAAADLAVLAALAPVRTALVNAPDPVQVAMAQPVSLRPEADEDADEQENGAKAKPKPAPKKTAKNQALEDAKTKDAFDVDPFESDKVAMAKKRRAVKQAPEPKQQVVTLAPEAYAQNMQSNEIFVNSRAQQQSKAPPEPDPIQAQGPIPSGSGPVPQLAMEPETQQAAPPRTAPRRQASSAPAPGPASVTITINPLAWRAVTLDGKPALVAVRAVTTPDGQLT
ncbi:MAG: hypothetical protein K8M05_35840, partial [Deltaproteobacteria bacterium]|nr:hypothetical protein [Kofleriaceae bacterium]